MGCRGFRSRSVMILVALAILAVQRPVVAAETFRFGLLMVGPYNDRGWSHAHYEAARHLEQSVPGTELVYIDKVNPADRPGVTVPQLVDELVEKGCRLVIANSDDMKDGVAEAALEHPEVYFIHVSGDHVLTGAAPANLSNLMGRMEYGKMMAGLVAGLTTHTGKIGYVGPLINEETRRLAASCYLGARYAWQTLRGKDPESLEFQVNWIGFWFNIPGVTADPTQVAKNFYQTGHDVVVSGIDTTEALVVAQQQRAKGEAVWAIPYDYRGACEGADESCLGVPYFNWVPGYSQLLEKARSGKWSSEWLWLGPDWNDLNNSANSSIGFAEGPGMSREAKDALGTFVKGMASGEINLFRGPLAYQDGSPFVPAGKQAEDRDVWYMKQLLQGMKGQSGSK